MDLMLKKILIMMNCLAMLGISACTQINDVTGSFEESVNSGRIQASGIDTRRFFRFHLRQFNHEIGGTFESFDMSGYDMFQQVPLYMTNALNLYYCARIDYGYVRDNTAHIVFTDKEQRQWMVSLDLGNASLSGTIVRVNHNNQANVYLSDADYLMPEDSAYYQQLATSEGISQIDLVPMSADSDDSLNCIYYYNQLNLKVVLPGNLPLYQCEPSQHQCHNYRLSVIGGRPQRHLNDLDVLRLSEIQSAYLDDCDIQVGMARTMILRDDPSVISGMASDLFIATAIVYKDDNLNGIWDSDSEPILAYADDQILMFYASVPQSAIYGESPDGKTYETPILSTNQIQTTTGWHVYEEDSEIPESQVNWRIINKLRTTSTDTLTLHDIPNAPQGCYISSQDESRPQCQGILPMIIQ